MNWYKIQAKANDTAEISIYDEIGFWGVTAQQFAKDLKALGNNLKQINLHIHSPGGDVFDGIAIYNLLKNHPANKTVYIDGLAASMASVIAMAGNEIIMPENAMMMIHKPWGIQGGDADDMRKYADLLDKVESTLIMAYVAKTGKSESDLAEMLKVETWLTGKECVEQGFADKLADPLVAMACIQSKKLEDYTNMPETIKNMLLNPQGNAGANRKPEQPQTPPQAGENSQNIAKPDVMAVLAQRNATIKATFAAFGNQFDGLLADCLADVSMTADQAKDKLLAKLGENTTPSVPQNHIHAGNGNVVGDSVKQSLMARAGQDTDKANAKDNAYSAMTLRELARASLVDRGVSISGYTPMQMVGLAFTHSSSDFGQILIDVAHKSLLKGWEVSNENYEQFTSRGILTDFRPAKRVGLGEFGYLPTVGEGEEYTYGTLGDEGASIALATYGQLFSITRQAIINDDMHLLTTIPQKMGQAARATIAKLVFALITGNATAQDGKKLFDASHKNSLTGAKLDVEHIDKAVQLMNGFVNSRGEPLAIEPEFMLLPTSLHTKAKQILGSSSVEGADINSGIINPIRDIVSPIKSPRLQIADAKSWYLINKEAIEVSYLDGVDSPYIEQQQGFSVDGVTTKVRIDAGVNVIDYRGIVKVTNQ
ncbi:ClpP-like prohead protease/major capsid protein fusion protein [Actinobacillus pleuropneumoniae]|uniref:ATP-dependent Clp protease proteolytic subunit n=3 Tax=Actinobacillus pleuropneumoniae TaxID=715 RepID=A0ABM6X2L1_ACTPL|nr:ClpP-like prohead protease/major capsid protein fusion protein [Actinobacillus pleuropneumoniae]ASU16480.1 ATP-dependent Clp protease proteolytic subunit 1 [Actinobacillus pleuropneumoniae]AWG94936.1 peptidase S14 [Actinobacillus pleuropneumoniae serovar 1 str. 4074]AXA21008.1 Clp protease ClpP [Actinobacillus pleuropneumoniae]EFM94577.1 ATP-dependent Clp protease proteolytic subunit [Actinobacillus pleuropneumoniae serovar 9 str. CVJ13261]EFM98987.1 ATP-dependent Clp protease proteolytic s